MKQYNYKYLESFENGLIMTKHYRKFMYSLVELLIRIPSKDRYQNDAMQTNIRLYLLVFHFARAIFFSPHTWIKSFHLHSNIPIYISPSATVHNRDSISQPILINWAAEKRIINIFHNSSTITLYSQWFLRLERNIRLFGGRKVVRQHEITKKGVISHQYSSSSSLSLSLLWYSIFRCIHD